MLSAHPMKAPFAPAPLAVCTESRTLRSRTCQSNLKQVCDLLHVPSATLSATDDVVFQHLRFKTGQRVHTIGQQFAALYIVNSGFLKTVLIDEWGNEQVLGFPMKGDMLGVDGIHSQYYSSEAVALSDCDLIVLPLPKLTALSRKYVELENMMYGVMSRELVREHAMIGALGTLKAEARVARFLVSLADRYAKIGYSSQQFNLRMTRHEIGSYLGLTLETVSRTLSALNDIGLISVDQRTIGFKDAAALKALRSLPAAARGKRSPRAAKAHCS